MLHAANSSVKFLLLNFS